MRGWLFLCSSWKGDNEFDIPHTLRNINMLSYTSSSCHSLSLQANTHTVVAKESLDYMPSVSYKDHKDQWSEGDAKWTEEELAGECEGMDWSFKTCNTTHCSR